MGKGETMKSLLVLLLVPSLCLGWSGGWADGGVTGAQLVSDGSGGIIIQSATAATIATITNAGVLTAVLSLNAPTINATVVIDTPDIETGTVSARDGTLAATLSNSTGNVISWNAVRAA